MPYCSTHGTPADIGILSALRSATADAHRQLEDAVDIERRVADPARYHQLLRTFLGFYRPLESRLAGLHRWSEAGIDFPARRKAPWLVADLLASGLTVPQIDALPDCTELPAADTSANGFGCLYVLEGATLGGRHISTLLRDSPVPADARHFFNGYGEQTGALWREFLAVLEAHASAVLEPNRAEIVRAARETFSCLQGWCVRQWGSHESPG